MASSNRPNEDSDGETSCKALKLLTPEHPPMPEDTGDLMYCVGRIETMMRVVVKRYDEVKPFANRIELGPEASATAESVVRSFGAIRHGIVTMQDQYDILQEGLSQLIEELCQHKYWYRYGKIFTSECYLMLE